MTNTKKLKNTSYFFLFTIVLTHGCTDPAFLRSGDWQLELSSIEDNDCLTGEDLFSVGQWAELYLNSGDDYVNFVVYGWASAYSIFVGSGPIYFNIDGESFSGVHSRQETIGDCTMSLSDHMLGWPTSFELFYMEDVLTIELPDVCEGWERVSTCQISGIFSGSFISEEGH